VVCGGLACDCSSTLESITPFFVLLWVVTKKGVIDSSVQLQSQASPPQTTQSNTKKGVIDSRVQLQSQPSHLTVIVVVLLSRSLPSLYYSGWFVEDLAVIVVVLLSRSLPSLYYSGWFVEDLPVIVVVQGSDRLKSTTTITGKSSTNHPE
jgi:hypothetical protein